MLSVHPLAILTFRIFVRSLGLSLICFIFTRCSAPYAVGIQKPIAPAGALARQADAAHQLAAVRSAYLQIQRGDETAIAAYNYAVARLIEMIQTSGITPWQAPVNFSHGAGIHRFTMRPAKDLDLNHFKLIPTDTLVFKGDNATIQSVVPGIGAPMIAVDATREVSRLTHEVHREHVPLRNLTAIVRFEGNTATMELIDPYQQETISLAGRNRMLAADYGAAIQFGLAKSRVDKLGIVRLLRPSRYNDTVHINFLQPYDPKRIPVLMVHGLDSTPATFAPMYFKLLKDKEIRERYQFWVFSYPSGYPYPYSASLLRKELSHVNQAFPKHKDMVVIGHSMGSLLSRSIVTDADEKIWKSVFGKPVAETRITGRSRTILQESLVFDAQPKIDRVIFYSGPHRGSDLALNWIGNLFGRLVRLPGTMADVRDSIVSATIDPAAAQLTRSPNSIDTLSPKNYFVIEINKIPIVDEVTYHTVVGDRGKGDAPNSSDGVVAYWSSHLPGAASEKIVPSGHGSHEHPEGIEEARRILHLHLKSAR